MKKLSKERKGEILVMMSVMLLGFFPIILNFVTRLMPPILFAALSLFVAAAVLLVYMLLKGELKELVNRKSFRDVMGVVLFIVVFPSIFLYLGASMTSSVNVAILMQVEVFFTFLIVGRLTSELITPRKVLSSLFIVVGAIAVIYNGSFELNWGDLLIIAAAPFYPFGNIYAKKALALTSASAILFYRGLIGGMVLLLISIIFEDYDHSILQYFELNWFLILINGFVIYFLSKMVWYAGFKYLDISKAIPMLTSNPAFGVLYAFLFLREVPTVYQWIGFTVILFGVYVITAESKTDKIVEPE